MIAGQPSRLQFLVNITAGDYLSVETDSLSGKPSLGSMALTAAARE